MPSRVRGVFYNHKVLVNKQLGDVIYTEGFSYELV